MFLSLFLLNHYVQEGEATGAESGDKDPDSNPEKEKGDEDDASENGTDASVADENDKQAETSDKSTDITESNEKESDEQMQSDEKEASDDAMEAGCNIFLKRGVGFFEQVIRRWC